MGNSDMSITNMSRYLLLYVELTTILTCFIVSPHDAICAGESVPIPKILQFNNLRVKIGSQCKLQIPESITSQYHAAIVSLKHTISDLPIAKINVLVTATIIEPSKTSTLTHDATAALKKRESYVIQITDKEIKITGSDGLGLLHGLTTFESLIEKNNGDIQQGVIIDWPDHKIRALHVVLRMVSDDDIKNRIIRLARMGHFNTIIFTIADGVRLSSLEQNALPDAWSKEVLLDVISFARQNGLEVVPELKLLTHQYLFFKNAYPRLMYNKATYDPRNAETYRVVFRILDEVIDYIHPSSIHIGHDEVAGHNDKSRQKWLRHGEKMIPADLYLKDIMFIFAYLKNKNITTWLWGDMLISSHEFPKMNEKYLNGVEDYAYIRNKLPKGIVICDWHYADTYRNFQSTMQISSEGYKVLGATWKKKINIADFSKYVAGLPNNGEGMIATTWFLVQKKDWNRVADIIKTSAEAFWNAK